jgi:predicted nucleic acid-binding protein
MEVADGERVFVDSNIFIYHFSKFEKFSTPCLSFFQKVEDGKISAFASTTVLAEVLHRLMVIEAANKFNIQPKSVVKFLKDNPDKASCLTGHVKSIGFIEEMGISILPVTISDLRKSVELKKEFGLLTIDAINLSVMKNNELSSIASNDSDFKRIPWLYLYLPA